MTRKAVDYFTSQFHRSELYLASNKVLLDARMKNEAQILPIKEHLSQFKAWLILLKDPIISHNCMTQMTLQNHFIISKIQPRKHCRRQGGGG